MKPLINYFRFHQLGAVKIFGAPVFVHTSVFIFSVVIALLAVKAPAMGLIALVSYLGIITVHEIGHAFVAHRLGITVYRIDIGWLHGVCHYAASEYEWYDVLVSWGGVAAQLVISVSVIAIGATGIFESWRFFGPVLIFLGYFNFFAALLNSIPAKGFDGATMWRIIPLWFAKPRKRKPKKRNLRVVSKDE